MANGLAGPVPNAPTIPNDAPPTYFNDNPPPPKPKAAEGWYNVSYPGTKKGGSQGGASQGGPSMGALGMPSYQAAMQAYQQQQGKVDSIFGRNIGPDTGQTGILGKTLSAMLANPQGFDARTRQGHLTRLAEREAGVRTDQNRRLGNMAAMSGARGQTAGLAALQEQLRGESGSRLNAAELDFETQDQLLRQQALFEALRGSVGVAGIQAGLVGQHGAIAGASAVPVQGGQGAGGGGGAGSGQPTSFGDIKNRLPGETLAEQIRREAAARAAAQAAGQSSGGGFTPGNPSQAFGW